MSGRDLAWWTAADAASRCVAAELEHHRAIGLRGLVQSEEAAAWASTIAASRSEWSSDFGGEQFTLGRAFYTHLEEGRLEDYFAGAPAANGRVESVAPGLQARMRAIVKVATGGKVAPRRDFCGPGAHIFPAGEKVARRGGVVHFDLEGLPVHFISTGRRAISVVLMLQCRGGGGLRFWNVRHDPHEGTDEATIASRAKTRDAQVIRPLQGDVLVFDSLTLHQIEPFTGSVPRMSATVHAMEVGHGVWETWF